MKSFEAFLLPTLTMLILLAAVPRSHSAQNPASIERFDKLDKSVRELPQTSPDQKLKKATLLWAIEDAHAAQAAGGDKLVQYAKGAKHFYLVEIYPEWAKQAESVTLLSLPGGVAGFEVREAGKPFRVIFNPTEAPLVYRCGPNDADLQLHRNGEQYRPAWIGKDGREETNGAPAVIASADVARGISIPAYGHFVITSGAK